jgi:hypothetical protein
VFLSWLRAFSFTQLVEVPIYRFGLRASYLRAFAASAITHPIAWVVHQRWSAPWAVRTAAVEAFAVLVEAAWFGAAYGVRRGITWSLLANAVSFGLGLLSYWLFGTAG